MPCLDSRDSPSEIYRRHNTAVEHMEERHKEEIEALQARNDELARMLCGLCKATYDHDITFPDVEGLQEWWRQHQIADRERNKVGKIAYTEAMAAARIDRGVPWEDLTEEQRTTFLSTCFEYRGKLLEQVADLNINITVKG